MLDANNAWTDLPTALLFCKRYEKYDPFWIEEPFSPDDIENHSKLAERTEIPVATGEIEAGRWRFKELLDKRAAAILQADAAVCGGISEWRRIAHMAAGYGIAICPHWFHDLHSHLVASAPNAQYVEYFPDSKVLNFRKLINRQMECVDGDLLLTQMPGLGFEFEEDVAAKYGSENEKSWTTVK
jgi:L-alanine-DL-glutamate epimerase-like enolase superfamily enzyme